jgi:hypothetical protein
VVGHGRKRFFNKLVEILTPEVRNTNEFLVHLEGKVMPVLAGNSKNTYGMEELTIEK